MAIYNRPRSFIYIVLLSLMTFVHARTPLAADCAVYTEPEDTIRARAAYVAVGATVVVLGGAAVFLLCRSGESHCHSYSSSCDWSRYSPSYCHYNSSRHHHHDSSHSSSHASFDSSNDYSYYSYSRSAVPLPRPTSSPSRHHSSVKKEASSVSQHVSRFSASFFPHPVPEGQGSVTVFARLPNGTTQVLGKTPIGGAGGSPLCCGPFEDEGHYTFGISVDPGTTLPSQAKIGVLKIEVEGRTVESGDFFLPSHPPANYEPSPYVYVAAP